MSASIPAGSSDLYAVVDLSNKRKKIADVRYESAQESTSDIPIYAVVHKSLGQISQQDKNTKILNEHSSPEIIEDQEKIKGADRGYNLAKRSFKISWFPNKLAIAFFIALVLVMGIMIILFVIVFVKVGALESSQMPYNLPLLNQVNVTKKDYKLFDDKVLSWNETLSELSYEFQQKLANVSADFKGLSYQLLQVLSNISALFMEETDINEFLLNTSIASCADILRFNPSSSSGYYTFRSSTSQLTSVYCDMTRTCGNITGGWMRVAELTRLIKLSRRINVKVVQWNKNLHSK